MAAQDLPRRVCLSLLAHPDDAEILCAGTLIRLAEAGWEIHIATATAGDCGSAALSTQQISRIRRKEARTAAALIGATYHCLREKDAFVVFDRPTIRKAIDLFRDIAPSLVFTHPVWDYMLDHEQTHLLGRAASFAYSIPNASHRTLAAGSRIPYLYYCDPIEGKDVSGREVTPTTVVDISAQQDLKLRMLACHESQRSWLRSHHGMDEYLQTTRRHDATRGKLIGTAAGEAFVQHRGHAYPADDLLVSLFKPKKAKKKR